MPATPAITALDTAGIAHQIHHYSHDRRSHDYGSEAVDALGTTLGVEADQIFKTLVMALSGASSALGVALVPVPRRLSLKAAAAALGARTASLADPRDVTRATGYVLGGVSPLGQRSHLPTVIDSSALKWDRILISAGRRGLEVELAPRDLVALLDATCADIGVAN